MKRLSSILAATVIFTALVIYPTAASDAAIRGLGICAKLIIPSLFPFFTATMLLSDLGFADILGKLLAPVAAKLFGVSGKGATAFIVGLTGGYPLGAAYISDMLKNGTVDAKEASVLLPFCNNSGPAFIIGAVGAGVFSSSAVGLFLYAVHIFSAVVGGMILASKVDGGNAEYEFKAVGFAAALTDAVKHSVISILYVCGFVVTFSVFSELLFAFGPFDEISARLSAAFGCELQWGKALFAGIFELGNGVGTMDGLTLSARNLALAAFLLGWGGFSVHFQTFSLFRDTKPKAARYIFGRLIIALIAAITAYFGYLIF